MAEWPCCYDPLRFIPSSTICPRAHRSRARPAGPPSLRRVWSGAAHSCMAARASCFQNLPSWQQVRGVRRAWQGAAQLHRAAALEMCSPRAGKLVSARLVRSSGGGRTYTQCANPEQHAPRARREPAGRSVARARAALLCPARGARARAEDCARRGRGVAPARHSRRKPRRARPVLAATPAARALTRARAAEPRATPTEIPAARPWL